MSGGRGISLRIRALAMLVLVVVSVSLGGPMARDAGADIPLPDTPAGYCAKLASGPPNDTFKLAFCTDLVDDLNGIGVLLGLPVIQPTFTSLTSPVKVIFSSTPGPPNIFFDTTIFGGGAFPIEPCQITAFPLAYDSPTADGGDVSTQLHVLISHEVVHCYQNLVLEEFKSGLAASDLPKWISEGSATYLATLYANQSEDGTDSFWKGWIGGGTVRDETSTLTARSYDAVGWYSLVAHVNNDPLWSKMAGAWTAYLTGGAGAYIAALGGDSPSVAEAWAPSVLNMTDWGVEWKTFGIGVPSDAQPTEFTALTAGSDSDREAIAPLSAIVDDESDSDNLKDSIIDISVSDGFASVHDSDNNSDIGFANKVFCTGKACKAKAVSCPGDEETPLKLDELVPPFTVAVGGGANAATYEISKIPPPATPDTPTTVPEGASPCPGNPASDVGDPHLRTLNGGAFDFQGAGEYTLVRSTSDGVDAQVRSVPFGDGSTGASLNTAVAMRVGSTKVEVDGGVPPVLLIDGKPVHLAASGNEPLAGGGLLSYRNAGITDSRNDVYPAFDFVVSWPDGSQMDIHAGGLLNVTFAPPTSAVDTFSGLLNSWVIPTAVLKPTSSTSEILIGGNGHRYVIDPTTTAGFKLLYGPFAASWRVTQKTSLFTYPKGKSTSSYLVKGFPARPASLARLSQQKVKRAASICKAAKVTDRKLLDDCEFDVGVTGKSDFATAIAEVQSGATQAATTSPSTTIPPPSTATGSHPASYYFTHPCSAVTAAEVKTAIGPIDALVVDGNKGCDFRPLSAVAVDTITFSSESAAKFVSTTPDVTSDVPIASLGGDAYCIASSNPFLSGQSYVVAGLGTAGSIQILAGNCAQGTALAKDALSRVSGL